MRPNAPLSHVSVDDSLSYFLLHYFLNIFNEAEDEHRQGVVYIHQQPHFLWVMYKQTSALLLIPPCLVVEMCDLSPQLD